MAGEPPEKYALRIHTVKVVKAIELNLDVIAQRLVQQDFITSHQASNITGTLGISSFDKASKLMNSVAAKMVYDSRQKWFEKFVHILAEDITTGDLVKVLVEDFVGKKLGYDGDLLKYIHISVQQDHDQQPPSDSAPQPRPAPARTLDSKPSLRDLTILKTHSGDKIEIIKSLAPDWKGFGVFLNFDDVGAHLALIEARHGQMNPLACCRDMLTHWVSGNGEQPTTWRILVDLLVDCERTTLAEKIRQALSS